MTAAASRRALLAVIALAVSARVLTYLQIHEGPALHLHVWQQSDMSFFDRWARTIAAGDLLTRGDMRPYHGWQRTLACRALSGVLPAECSDAAVAKVWDGWVGRATFWQDPLYPYVLAFLYASVGGGEGVVYAAQALAGIACAWLVYSITATLFGAAAAFVAGATAAVYGPLLFQETLRLREVAIALATLAAVRATMTAVTLERRSLIAGALSGVSMLFKASGLLFAVALAALLAWRARGRPQDAARMLAGFAAGLLIAMSPLVARNVAVGVAPFGVASTGPLNFLNGNAVDYRSGPGTPVSGHALDILSSTGGRGVAVVRATLATHRTRVDWLALLGRKLAMFWRAPEIPDNANLSYFELQAPWLRFALGFGAVAPFALLGFVAGARKPGAWVALLNVATGIAVCVLFFNLGRFRLPVALGMLPFAGFALVWLIEAVGNRRHGGVAAGAALVVAAAVFVNAPDRKGLADIRLADYGVHNEITVHLAQRRADAGDLSGALGLLERQLETEPSTLAAIEPTTSPTPISHTLSGVAGSFASLNAAAARFASALGDEAKAARHRGRAAVLRALNAPYEAQGPAGPVP